MKIKILRNYGSLKKGQELEADDKISGFLIGNGIAKKVCLNDDCGECEDCNKKKAKTQVTIEKEPKAEKPKAKKRKYTKKAAKK
mgnify:CR=1 FL=1